MEEAARSALGADDELERGVIPGAITQDEIAAALAKWETVTSEALGRKLKFRRWREFTSVGGHMRYVTVNRIVGAVAVAEARTYDTPFVTNRAAWALRTGGPRDES